MKRLLFAAALLASLACNDAPETAAPPQPPKPSDAADSDEKTNLLNIAYGAAVVSRTGELTLDHSPVRAIDGDLSSIWSSPPADTEHTITLSLPAPATIDKLGFVGPRAAQTSLQSVAFETSTDGITFSPATTLTAKDVFDLQLASIAPVRAQYVRVNVGRTATHYSGITSLHARGRTEGKAIARPLAGCWSINGFPAAFADADGRITGILKPEDPVHLEGGVEGAVYRFAWSHGAEAGIALVTMTPDGNFLTGAKWYEQPVAEFWGDSWFGKRGDCAARATDAQPPHRTWLRRRGRYALYSLQDFAPQAAIATVKEVLSRTGTARIKLLSRELREPSEDANLKIAQQRLDAFKAALQKSGVDISRIDFETLGSARPLAPIQTEAAKLLFSAIEIEVPDTARSLF